MLLTGRFIPAAEALGLGIVTRLESSEHLDRAVRDCALGIAANAPLTVRATKEMIRRIMTARRLPAGEDRDIVTMCYTSRDFREGVEAFMAKRPPVWQGK
jgi:enoyl-CoA hydratase/carnithine racemase